VSVSSSFDSNFWTDRDMRRLDKDSKLLFAYLFTNPHKNMPGLYRLYNEDITRETGLSADEVKTAFKRLDGKAHYDYDEEVVYVPSHVKRQFMRRAKISPKHVSGISSALMKDVPQGHPFVAMFIDKYSPFFPIDYPYRINGRKPAEQMSTPSYEEILDYLNRATGKDYKPTEQNMALIDKRWAEGYIFEDFKTAIDLKAKEWNDNPEMRKYLRPITLFGDKFADYRNEAKVSPEEKRKLSAQVKALRESIDENQRRLEDFEPGTRPHQYFAEAIQRAEGRIKIIEERIRK
jgi:uncharacterized phage protein (TIGR02220 family)